MRLPCLVTDKLSATNNIAYTPHINCGTSLPLILAGQATIGSIRTPASHIYSRTCRASQNTLTNRNNARLEFPSSPSSRQDTSPTALNASENSRGTRPSRQNLPPHNAAARTQATTPPSMRQMPRHEGEMRLRGLPGRRSDDEESTMLTLRQARETLHRLEEETQPRPPAESRRHVAAAASLDRVCLERRGEG